MTRHRIRAVIAATVRRLNARHAGRAFAVADPVNDNRALEPVA